MTDISKYKNVSLSKDTYTKIDRLRRAIVPNTIISRSQTVNILVNEKVEKLNGRRRMFKISREERQKLLNYLKGRPYEEVFTLIALIVGLKPVENSKAKEDDKKKN